MMKAIRVSPKVWWVGAIDWQLKEFHGYTTRRGSTYNAFLIMDRKVTLVDTVKAPFLGEMMERIASVVDPAKIDVIVSNHAEMDHSGSLPETIARVNPSAVYASTLGVKALEAHFHELARKITPVKSGDAIELGESSLKFVETRMLHWPDSMFSYLTGDNILFSQDGFGMHYAVAKIFADENDQPTMREEAERYYANILLPYSPQVLKLLEAFPGSDSTSRSSRPTTARFGAATCWVLRSRGTRNSPNRRSRRTPSCCTTPCGTVPKKWRSRSPTPSARRDAAFKSSAWPPARGATPRPPC